MEDRGLPDARYIFYMAHASTLIEKCRLLRKGGYTLNEIIEAVKLPKTTVYYHISAIPLSSESREKITKRNILRLQLLSKRRKGKCAPGRTLFLPKDWSKELVFVTAHFMFDGSIRYGGCDYYNRNISLIESMRKTVKKVFEIDSAIYERDFGVKQLRYNYVELGQFVKNKADQLLAYIRSAPLEYKKVFLKAFFDDEGGVRSYKNIRTVRGFQHNTKTLILIHDLLKDFNIESSVDAKYNEIVISRKDNLIRFRDHINFSKGIYINPDRKNSIWRKKLEKRAILSYILRAYKT